MGTRNPPPRCCQILSLASVASSVAPRTVGKLTARWHCELGRRCKHTLPGYPCNWLYVIEGSSTTSGTGRAPVRRSRKPLRTVVHVGLIERLGETWVPAVHEHAPSPCHDCKSMPRHRIWCGHDLHLAEERVFGRRGHEGLHRGLAVRTGQGHPNELCAARGRGLGALIEDHDTAVFEVVQPVVRWVRLGVETPWHR